MPRVKNLNIIVTYGDTGYVINDFGPDKSPRFELYHIPTKKSIKKSNNPLYFDEIRNFSISHHKKQSKC